MGIASMVQERESYEGMPVFEAATSKSLEEAVQNYRGRVEKPYVVRIPEGRKAVKAGAFCNDDSVGIVLIPESVFLIGFAALERLMTVDEFLACIKINKTE